MFRVYYDVTRLLHRGKSDTPTGIDRVDVNYAHYFSTAGHVDFVAVYQHDSVFYLLQDGREFVEGLYDKWILSKDTGFDFVDRLKSATKRKRTPSETLKRRRLQDPEVFDGALLDVMLAKRDGRAVYLNTSHHGVGHYTAYQAFKVLGGAAIGFYLHDIIPVDYPEYVREGDEVLHAKRVAAMAQYGDFVLANSEFTKARFLQYCEANQLPTPPCSIAVIGVEDGFQSKLAELGSGGDAAAWGDYFVYVSTIEPRKNHLMLLQLWRKMALEGRADIPKLVLIGKRGWNNQNIVEFLDRSPAIQAHVVELSGLSDDRLIGILKGSKALLYPSFVEGWGMPLVEAIAAGVPVVCSDIPAHRESGQGVVEYLDPMDAAAWQQAIERLLADDSVGLECVSRYSSYRFPSWGEHFVLVEQVIEAANVRVVREHPSNVETYCARKVAEDEVVLAGEPVHVSLFARIAIKILFGDVRSPKSAKLMRKFRKDPVAYFADSKNAVLRAVASVLRAADTQ